MRKIFAFAMVTSSLLAATPAQAEVKNYRGTGKTRVAACSDAKNFARNMVNHNRERIVRYGPCECSVSGSGEYTRYTCIVDAYIEPLRD